MKEMPAPLLTPQTLTAQAGRVCVAVSGDELFDLATESLRDCRFLEFRLDTLSDPAAQLPALRHFLATNDGVTAVATCRRTAYGGHFNGTAQEQIGILTQAAAAGCALVQRLAASPAPRSNV